MEEKNLMRIKFGSFVKLSVSMFLGLGIGFGVLLFLLSLLGLNVTATIGETVYSGITAGVIAIFLGPLIAVVLGLFISLVGFLPFKFFLKSIKGIRLKMELK